MSNSPHINGLPAEITHLNAQKTSKCNPSSYTVMSIALNKSLYLFTIQALLQNSSKLRKDVPPSTLPKEIVSSHIPLTQKKGFLPYQPDGTEIENDCNEMSERKTSSFFNTESNECQMIPKEKPKNFQKVIILVSNMES